jgi:hypothetical protein
MGGQIAIGIIVLDSEADSIRLSGRLFFNIRPGIFLIVDKRHGFTFAFREMHQKNNNRMHEDWLDDDPVPLSFKGIFYFERLIERQGFLFLNLLSFNRKPDIVID